MTNKPAPTSEDYLDKVAYRKYESQRRSAEKRNIDWKFTFSSWFIWWKQTGHWEDRGRGKGKYCMARFGDIGAYEESNVFCQLHVENSRDGGKHFIKVRKGRPNSLKGEARKSWDEYSWSHKEKLYYAKDSKVPVDWRPIVEDKEQYISTLWSARKSRERE